MLNDLSVRHNAEWQNAGPEELISYDSICLWFWNRKELIKKNTFKKKVIASWGNRLGKMKEISEDVNIYVNGGVVKWMSAFVKTNQIVFLRSVHFTHMQILP